MQDPNNLCHHGDHLLKNNTSLSLKDGFSTVIKGKLSFLQPDLDDALQFLTDLFKTGLSYSSLNTARGGSFFLRNKD
jgi:hypothetical protein